MKKRPIMITVYIIILFSCVWFCTDNISVHSKGEYDRMIETLSYQLAYKNTYASVYSPFASSVLETALDNNITEEKKTIYLTFDDGPSPRTAEILDILAEYDIKATFFVINAKDEYTQYLQRAVAEGHTIGVHSASHKYREIYKSVDNYLADFTLCYDYIYGATGYSPTIFRFPGGSVNDYNAAVRKDIAKEMTRRGFVYFDWNVESSDSGSGLSSETIYRNVINGCNGKQRAIVIMHDSIGKKTTVEALEKIIQKLKEDGWSFSPLTNEIKPVIFRMK